MPWYAGPMVEPKYGAMASITEPKYVDEASPFDPATRSPFEPVPGDTSSGALGKGTKVIFWLLAVTFFLALTSIPAILVTLFLAPDPSNFPFFALALLPLGPAISAGLWAIRARYRSEDAGPTRAFWHGYRANFLPALSVWVPALLILGIIGYTLLFGSMIELSQGYRAFLVAIGVLVLMAAMHALSLVTFFNFRFSDIWRLAAFQIWDSKVATLGLLAVAIIAFGLVWFVNEWLLVLLGGILVYFWYWQVRPALKKTADRFTPSA